MNIPGFSGAGAGFPGFPGFGGAGMGANTQADAPKPPPADEDNLD